MSARHDLRTFGYEPEPDLRDLLRALAGAGPATKPALDLVARALRGEADRGVEKLLPLVADTNLALRVSPDDQRALVRRRAAARARFVALEGIAKRIARALEGAGARPLFLKGFALACRFYDRPEQRPMGDIDVAVPHDQFRAAAGALQALGFEEMTLAGSRHRHMPGVNTHAVTFRNATLRLNLDLHYNIFNCSIWEQADDGFWAAALPLAHPGMGTALTLAPEHHVLHACLHGYTRSPGQTPVRWMLDAHKVLSRLGTQVRWPLLEQEALRHRCGPLAAAALDYLAATLQSPVPEEVRARLAGQPMPDYDFRYFQALTQLIASDSLPHRLHFAWTSSQRQLGRSFATPIPFVLHMARCWGASSPHRFLWDAVRHVQTPSRRRDARSTLPGNGGPA